MPVFGAFSFRQAADAGATGFFVAVADALSDELAEGDDVADAEADGVAVAEADGVAVGLAATEPGPTLAYARYEPKVTTAIITEAIIDTRLSRPRRVSLAF